MTCAETTLHGHGLGKGPMAVLSFLLYVEITINIPEELAHQVASKGKDPARVALEALAVEGYSRELLSESA